MTLKIILSGNALAKKPVKFNTLAELLLLLVTSPYYKMLRTTANLISDFLKHPIEEIALVALVGRAPRFREYLENDRHYPTISARSYANFCNMFIRLAKQLGWAPPPNPLSAAWKQIADVVTKHPGCKRVINFLIQLGRTPSQLTDDDLDAFTQESVQAGKSYGYAVQSIYWFRRLIRESGLSDKVPGVCCVTKYRYYGKPLHLFPAKLGQESKELLDWKLSLWVEDRPDRFRVCAATADRLESILCKITGFVLDIEGRSNVSTLLELITKPSVAAWVKWQLNERHLDGESLAGDLRLLYAALRQNPRYKGQFDWLHDLIGTINCKHTAEKIKNRKEKKWVKYEVLRAMRAEMHEQRTLVTKRGIRALAELVHDELLILWLLTLPWRQRNLRECKLGHNLLKAELPAMISNKVLPKWVLKKLKTNPNEQFWQFRFTADETKGRRSVWAIVPECLVAPLEEYLHNYRQVLLPDGSDVHNLFLNRKGGPLTKAQVGSSVSNLTLKYTGRKVNPHLFRDIFVHYALNHHPEKLNTTSKHLWHKDLTITTTIYGWMFDEAEALCQIEEWFDETEEQSPEGQAEPTPPVGKKPGTISKWYNPKKDKAA